jgi:hypothetical protein
MIERSLANQLEDVEPSTCFRAFSLTIGLINSLPMFFDYHVSADRIRM